jgi:hypothetical protein
MQDTPCMPPSRPGGSPHAAAALSCLPRHLFGDRLKISFVMVRDRSRALDIVKFMMEDMEDDTMAATWCSDQHPIACAYSKKKAVIIYRACRDLKICRMSSHGLV